MNSSELFFRLKSIAENDIICDVGLANISELDHSLCQTYTSAVSIIVPLSKGVLKEIIDKPTITYFSHYRAVNKKIDELTLKLALEIEKQDYLAYPIPASQSDPFNSNSYSAVFPHKTAAVLAGKGWIGKNALFIHHRFGPAVRLGTVLTTFESEKVIPMKSRCENCKKCRINCPAQAIEGVQWTIGMKRNQLIDVYACSEYMKSVFQNIGRGSVCGLCIVNCPYAQIKEVDKNDTKSL